MTPHRTTYKWLNNGLFTLLLAILIPFTSKASQVEFYSESVHSTDKDVTTNSTWMKFHTLHFLNHFNLLLSAGYEQASYDNSSDIAFAFGGAGLRFKLRNIGSLSYEYRKRAYTKDYVREKDFATEDHRFLLNLGHYFPEISLSDSNFYFNEIYSETLFSTWDQHNTTNFDFLRTGFKNKLNNELYLYEFLEFSYKWDKHGHYYSNLFSILPTLRASYYFSNMSLSLSTSYFKNFYIDSQISEFNPYKKKDDGLRILFVVGGNF